MDEIMTWEKIKSSTAFSIGNDMKFLMETFGKAA